jgi:hypothetical protein
MTLTIPERKIWRSEIIVKHMQAANCYRGAVIFSCGNASNELKRVLLKPIITIAPGGDLQSCKWWTSEEIKSAWPEYFDATSGHLPFPLMARLAEKLKAELHGFVSLNHNECFNVPTGSGETILCLRLAFPDKVFIPITDGTPATKYNHESVVARIV